MTNTTGFTARRPGPRTVAACAGGSPVTRSSVRRGVPAAIACAVVLTAVAGLHAQAASKSFVWKATSKQGGTVYLAGSIHLLSDAYYPLSPAFETAFKDSDLLVEEIDLGEMMDTNSQLMLLTRGMLSPTQSLDKMLSPATFAAVNAKVTELGLPMEPLKRFKPWALAITLQGLEWQKAGFDADLGLDKHFFDRAKAQGKQVQGLETLAYQIARFDEMSPELQDRLLAETLKELETTKASFTQMADAWKSGDAASVERVVLQDLKSEPQMYERLLVERNRNWLPKIEALFSRPRPSLVIVGAAHLVGADGLLQMLRSKGYTVEQR